MKSKAYLDVRAMI